MTLKLNRPFAANAAADEYDVLQVKKALNRLGYYMPFEKTGMTGIPDRDVFDALKQFQGDHGLPATGTTKPGDDTEQALNSAANQSQDGQYIWRTVGDSKVRKSHAELEGEIRDWGDSPDPGEEPGCRCWAEPVQQPLGLKQIVTSSMAQKSYKWTNEDFKYHWKHGNGREVTLPEIGWLVEIIWHAKKIMFHKVEKQIADKAREVQSGTFSNTWENTYDFEEVVFSIGDSVIRGRFAGDVRKEGDILHINATAHYLLDDEFSDPSSIRENVLGSSDPDILWDNPIGDATLFITELGNTPYPITGTWTTKVTGSISSKE